MIHTDGTATVSSSGDPSARLADVFNLKPLIVEDAMQREIVPEVVKGDFRAMNYGAWRVLKSLRESIEKAEEPMTVEQLHLIVVSLELTYEGLYRGGE